MIARNLFAAAACLSILPIASTLAADRDYVEDSDFTKTVAIAFSGSSATVTNGAGVTITSAAGSSGIVIDSAVEGVNYILSGSSASGYVQISSSYPAKVTLNGVSLTSTDGPAISILSTERGFVDLAEGSSNSLTDSASYTRSGSGTLHATGPMILSGHGSLTVAGMKSHAINSNSYLRALGGDVKVSGAVKDAVHVNAYFRMDHGNLDLAATGDGIDADAGYVLINGGSIKVRSTVADTKGIKCDGTMMVNGGAISMSLDGVQGKGLSNKADLSINGGSLAFDLSGAVYLETVTGTSGSYVDPSYCTAIKSDANVAITGGSITITHTGTAGKGISAGGNVSISGGSVDVATSGGVSTSYTNSLGATDAASADGIKADGTLTITNGSVTASSSGASGDCLASDLALSISGGTVAITVDGASGDGIGTKQALTVSGGTLGFTARGAQSKAMKSGTDMTIRGGVFSFAMSGAAVLEQITGTTRYNPSYCTAMKCDGNLNVSAGTIGITHSGQAGKGISVDGNITISGGSFNIATSGSNTSSFTNASGTLDMAAADCLKGDGNLTITGGTIITSSTGAAADAIACDGVATIGVLGVASTPVISASTSGARVLLSGSGQSADYVNPKAFKAGGNLTMNGGSYTGSTAQNGGEGLESKANLTIAGGTVEINSYDDGINASTKITISGGSVYCYSANNDGIDSNGTILISGGVIVSSGYNAPEEGFDCDQNNFTITGGIMIGTGGATSTPTASTSTQRSVVYRGPGTANVILQVKPASGSTFVYKLPRTYSNGSSTGMTMLFSLPTLAAGTSYSILSGVTVSGGTEFHGLYTGATVSGGTTLKTFTPTNMVTTVQ